MKIKLITILLIMFIIIAGFNNLAYAENALTKLGRGLVNTATGWLEVPKKVYNISKEENILVGITVGTAKGIGWGIARTAVGVYEVVTFPFPIPEEYETILDPEYVFGME